MSYEVKSDNWKDINEQAKLLIMMPDLERIQKIQKVMNICNEKERAIISFFYIYGMRPAELLEMKKLNFSIKGKDLWCWLPTKKKGHDRIIVLSINNTPFLDAIVSYLDTIPLPEFRLFHNWSNPTSFNKIIKKIEKRYYENYNDIIKLTPYIFRKFRDSLIISMGTIQDALTWRGTTNPKVLIEHYSVPVPITKFKKSIR